MGNKPCKSSCFESVQESIELEIHNEIPNFEERVMKLIENKLVPLIEKVVLDYIEKRFPSEIKIPLIDKDNEND